MNDPDPFPHEPGELIPTDPSVPPIEAPSVELVEFRPPSIEGGEPVNMEAEIEALASEKRGRLVFYTWLVAILVVLVVVGPPVYRYLRSLRAATLAREAEALVQKQQVDEAIATVHAAYRLDRNNPEVMRAMAQTLTALNFPDAISYWTFLLATPVANDDDRRAAAEAALRQQMYTQAAQIIAVLLSKEETASNLLLAARLNSMMGDKAKAMAFATRATLLDPNNKPAAIFLALQELNNPYLENEGLEGLLKIAEGNDVFGLLALQRIASEHSLKPEQITHIIDRLHQHPDAGELQRITALGLQIELTPEKKEDLLDTAVQEHQHASLESLQQFAAWLNSINEPGRVLDVVTEKQAFSSKELFSTYVNALAALKKWSDLEEILKRDRVPLEESYIEVYLSQCAEVQGDHKAAALHWRNAETAAAHHPREMFFLAYCAETTKQYDRAESLYRALTQEPLVARIAFFGLLRVDSRKETKIVRDILDQMTARWPQDVSIVNDDIYYNLLLKEVVTEMTGLAEIQVKNEPTSLPHRTNLALGYLRQNEPAKALEVYRDYKTDWDKASGPALVVYIATMRANGRGEQVRHLSLMIDKSGLRPEELALLQ